MEGKKRGYDYSGGNIVITVGNIDSDVRGKYYERYDGVIEIVINEVYFGQSYITDTITIFHELGHGLLKRSHKSKCSSIMSSGYGCRDLYWQLHKEKMLDELFSTSFD